MISTDPDGDPLTHSGTATTAKGSVVVNADGTFGYTPTDTARHASAAADASEADQQDTFAVTIDDGHGGVTSVPVAVAISPANIGPSGAATAGTPDSDTGVVTGKVTGSDPDNDPLIYSGSATTTKGSVVVNADGTFTYTPTDAARHAAAADTATAADKRDSFDVTIDDGHGAASSVSVTVTIGSSNAEPSLRPNVDDPKPDTGSSPDPSRPAMPMATPSPSP